jgi:hypothetical protein
LGTATLGITGFATLVTIDVTKGATEWCQHLLVLRRCDDRRWAEPRTLPERAGMPAG